MSIYYGSRKVSGAGAGGQYVKLTRAEYDEMKAAGAINPNTMYCTTDEIDQFDLASLSAEVWNFYISGESEPMQKKVIVQR